VYQAKLSAYEREREKERERVERESGEREEKEREMLLGVKSGFTRQN
jgi:hypothetical protein